MSETQEPKTPEGRINTIIGAIKTLMIEDPLIGALFVVLIVPAGLAVWTAVPVGDTMTILLSGVIIVVSVILVFIPLLIVKSNRTAKTQQEKARLAIITDQRARLKATWEKDQERTDSIVQAKLTNLQAQTQFLLDQSERYEKALIKESAQKIKEGVEARFQELELVKEASCLERVTLVLENFKKIGTQYNEVLSELSRFRELLSKLSGELQPTSEPEITFPEPEPVSDAPEPEPLEKKAMTELSEDMAAVAEKEETGPHPDESIKEEPLPKVTIKQLKQDESEGLGSKSILKEALNVINNIYEGDRPAIEVTPELPTKIEPISWTCPDCGRVLNERQNRCSACGRGKPA